MCVCMYICVCVYVFVYERERARGVMGRFSEALGVSNHNDRPLTEYINFKKSQFSSKFSFVWFNI